MSDSVKNAVAGLKDDPTEAAEAPASAPQKPRKAPRTKVVEVGSSEQRGARKDPAYTQLATTVRKDLRASLWYYLKREEKTMSSLIEELLEDWVEEQGGIVEPQKKGKGRVKV
jgi:hypothetical protein